VRGASLGALVKPFPSARIKILNLLLVTALAALLAVSLTYVLPSKFVASASILLDSSGDFLGLANIGPLSEMLPSSALGFQSRKENGFSYAAICNSRETLVHLLAARLDSTSSATYLSEFVPRTGSPTRRTEIAVDRLRRSITTRFDQRSGIFQVSVAHQKAAIAAGVANLLVRELKRFNAEVRTTKARDAVSFIQDRLGESRRNLSEAEERLVAFRNANARIGNAPELLLQQSRLERTVRLAEDVYALLARQYEMARIQEKNESPVFTALDVAVEPSRPNRMSRIVVAVVAASLAGLVYLLYGTTWAVSRLPARTSSASR
jgi:uncharacterized protein involved in exopolysaccharide biosynthesis